MITRFIFIIASTLFLSSPCLGQRKTCKQLHVGVFRITNPNSGITIITRTKSTQTEENTTLGTKVILGIKWIDDCVYELRLQKFEGNSKFAGKKSDIITVRIKDLEDDYYTAETSANFVPDTLRMRVEIVQ